MARKESKSDRLRREQREGDLKNRVLECMGRAEKGWSKRASAFRARHKAYLGLMSPEEKARWDTPLAPRYAMHSIETLVANLLEKRRPVVLPTGPEDVETADLYTRLLEKQRDRDERAQKDDRFVRETTIMGVGVMKMSWAYRTLTREFTRWEQDPATSLWTRRRDDATRPIVDQPSADPLDVYDWFPDPSASRANQMGWCIARYWVPLEKLRELERRTHDDGRVEGAYHNLDQLQETRSTDASNRSKRYTGRDHGDCVEVLEFWSESGTVALANREVVIQDDQMHYDHGELPWGVAHTIPDLYTMEGLSVAEVIAPLQTAAWEVLNSLVRNTRVASLLLVKKQRDADVDEEALELASGDIVETDSMDALEFWHPSSSVLDAGLQMLQVLKTTMQETSGASAYLSGGATETIDQKTATGISIIQSSAQKLLQAWRRSLDQTFTRLGRQEIGLNQQYLRSTERIRTVAPEGGTDFVDVFPWDIAGEYDFSFSVVDQDLNEQQRRAEAGMLFDRMLAAAPLLAPMGYQLKVDRAFEDLLEAFGRIDVEDYLEEAPLPPAIPGALPGGALGAPPAPGTPPGAGAGGAMPVGMAA